MSGVAALARLGGPVDRAPLARVVRSLDARGPEARAQVAFEAGALAMTVGAPGEAGSGVVEASGWVVAADGELLNLRSLAAELRAWGEAPDVETTPAIAAVLFAARGFSGGLERLAGDVAVVAWDARTRCLWAARDRAGHRPLHWARTADGTVVIASEPGALLAHPGVDATIDAEGLREALAFGAPIPPRTAWRGVHALAPGELLTVDVAGPRVTRWWRESANPTGADGARYRWARSVQFGAELAIQQRVAVEAPLAVALSGGVYAEALLLAAAARRREPLVAVTLAPDGVADPRAAASAERARARHVIVPLPTGEVPALLGEVVAAEPILAPEALGFRALARAVSDAGVEVLLSGVGGAALFGGDGFPVAERAASLPGLGALARAAARARPDWARRHVTRTRGPAPDAALAALARQAPSDDPVGAALWLDRRLDAGDALAALDRAAGAHGVRAQSPFADAQLAQLVASVPAGHLVQVRRPRGIFLDALAERLGSDAPAHQPMVLPLAAWLASGVREGVAESLEGIVPGDEVRAALAGPPSRRSWALAALAAWRRARG